MRYIVECRQHKHDNQSYDTSKSRSALIGNKYKQNFEIINTTAQHLATIHKTYQHNIEV